MEMEELSCPASVFTIEKEMIRSKDVMEHRMTIFE